VKICFEDQFRPKRSVAICRQLRAKSGGSFYDEKLIGSWRGPRTVPSDQTTSPASVKRGMRFSHSSTATVISKASEVRADTAVDGEA